MADKKQAQFETPEDLDEFMSDEPGDLREEGEDAFEEESIHSSPEPEDVTVPGIDVGDKEDDMLDIAADVPVQVVAVMGKKNVTLKELASMRIGGVVELDRPANEIVDLVAGGKLIAKGELVEIEGKLGIRIVKMMR